MARDDETLRRVLRERFGDAKAAEIERSTGRPTDTPEQIAERRRQLLEALDPANQPKPDRA